MKLRKAVIEISGPNPEEIHTLALAMLNILPRDPGIRVDLSLTPWVEEESSPQSS